MQALKTIEEAMGANSAVHYCELYIEMATFSIENSTKKAASSMEIRNMPKMMGAQPNNDKCVLKLMNVTTNYG